MIDRKYFRYKIKKAAVTCATIFVALTAIKNFPTAEENPVPQIEIKPVAVEKTEKPPLEKVKPRENPKKVDWAEIKIPETVNLSINPTVKIFEINTIEDSEKVTDPRLNYLMKKLEDF